MTKEKKSEPLLRNKDDNGIKNNQEGITGTRDIKRWQVISLLCIVINIVILIWILVTSTLWFIEHNHKTLGSHEDLYCVPSGLKIVEGCEQTSLSDGTDACCSNVTLGERIQQLSNVSYEQQKFAYYSNIFMHHCSNQSQSKEKLPAARVVGPSSGFKSKFLKWDEKSRNSFLFNITYVHGRFKIRKGGFYYVYSQVTFLEQSVRMPSSLPQLRHTVLRQRGSAPKADMVLQDSLSACKLQTGTSNSSSFVGAAFRLEKGDEIMVEVSDYTLVAKSEISNYFGLHMI